MDEAQLGKNVREMDRPMVEIAGVLWGFREVRCRVWIRESAGRETLEAQREREREREICWDVRVKKVDDTSSSIIIHSCMHACAMAPTG